MRLYFLRILSCLILGACGDADTQESTQSEQSKPQPAAETSSDAVVDEPVQATNQFSVQEAEKVVFEAIKRLPRLGYDVEASELDVLEQEVLGSFTQDATLIMGNQRVPVAQYVQMARNKEAFIPIVGMDSVQLIAPDTLVIPITNENASFLKVGFTKEMVSGESRYLMTGAIVL